MEGGGVVESSLLSKKGRHCCVAEIHFVFSQRPQAGSSQRDTFFSACGWNPPHGAGHRTGRVPNEPVLHRPSVWLSHTGHPSRFSHGM